MASQKVIILPETGSIRAKSRLAERALELTGEIGTITTKLEDKPYVHVRLHSTGRQIVLESQDVRKIVSIHL